MHGIAGLSRVSKGLQSALNHNIAELHRAKMQTKVLAQQK